MEKIAPRDRYSHNLTKSLDLDDVVSGVLARLKLDSTSTKTELLSGGFMNSNFRVSSAGNDFVIRIYSADLATARREYDLLTYLNGKGLATPKPHSLIENLRQPVVTMEYLDGITLQDRLNTSSIDPKIFSDLGRELAGVHQIQFSRCGFIGPDVTPGNEYENFPDFIKAFIFTTLNWLQGHEDRLDLTTAKRVRELIHGTWNRHFESTPAHQLVHCDFNPKNIIVSRSGPLKLLGFIDWEFCLSGDGLSDLGNFFRFEYDYPAGAARCFQDGYQSAGGYLRPEWRDSAMLLDLGNMFSFLERRENYQESFRTARAVIQNTLDHFGY